MAPAAIGPDDALSHLTQLSESLRDFFSGPPGRAESLAGILFPFFSSLGWDRISPVRTPRCIRVEPGWYFYEVEMESSFPPLPRRFRRVLVAVSPAGTKATRCGLEMEAVLRGAWNLNRTTCIHLSAGRFELYDTSFIRWGRSPLFTTIGAWSPGDPGDNAVQFRNSVSPVPQMWRIARYNRTLTAEPEEIAFTLQDALSRRVRYWKEGAERMLKATDPGLTREERRIRSFRIVLHLILATMDRELQELCAFPRPPEEGTTPHIRYLSIPGFEEENLRRLYTHTIPGPDFFLCPIPPEIYSRVFFVLLNQKEHRLSKKKKKPLHEPETPTAPPDVVTAISAGMLLWALREEGRGVGPVRILDPFCRTGRFLLELTEMNLCWGRDESSGPENIPAEGKTGPGVRYYGVDPDPVMAECTRFVLFLQQNVPDMKEPDKEPAMLSRYFNEHDQPGISVIRGNAIIGPDILTDLFRAETGSAREPELSPLDWKARFPWVIESGFDGIGGEFLFPPDRLPRTVKDYLERRYRSYRPGSGLKDCYLELSLNFLTSGGSYSVLLPGDWLSAAADADARRMISEKEILAILEYGPDRTGTTVHREGGGYCVITGKNAPPAEMAEVMHASTGRVPGPVVSARGKIPAPSGPGGWSLVDRRLGQISKLIRQHGIPLAGYLMGEIYRGTLPEGFRPEPTQDMPGMEPTPGFVPYLLGSSVSPYARISPDGYIPVSETGTTPSPCRQEPGMTWTPPGTAPPDHGPAENIVIATGPQSLQATIGPRGMCYDREILYAPHPDRYLIAVINSLVARFYMGSAEGKPPGRPADVASRALSFPVHVIDTTVPEECRIRERIQLLVERMFLLVGTPENHAHGTSDKLAIRIRHTGRAIDTLVCRLYGINASQQKLMEEYLSARQPP